MEILNYSFDGEGMQRVFENEKWTVGIKNWKPANDITGINNLERHNKTDELFVLVAGSCTLIYANVVLLVILLVVLGIGYLLKRRFAKHEF